VGTDTSSVVSGAPNLTTTATTVSVVGSYPITAAVGTLTAGNYSFSIGPNGALTVNPATLIVVAVNTSDLYGAALPAFTYTVGGYQSATDYTGAPDITTTAVKGSPVGTYTITPATGTLVSTNYTFAFKTATLTITKVTLAVTANNLSMVKGQAVPTLTYTVAGLVNGDTSKVYSGVPALSTTATSKSAAGKYPITIKVGTLTVDGNYSFSFVNGTLTVTAE
jgi:hypothetical protein